MLDLLSAIPAVGDVFDLLSAFQSFLANDDRWKVAFAEAITDATDRKDIQSKLNSIKSKMETSVQLTNLNNTNIPENIRIGSALIFLNGFSDITNEFKISKNLFLKYPLIGLLDYWINQGA